MAELASTIDDDDQRLARWLKPPVLLQDLVLLENGDLRHKQREHVSNLYYVCSTK